MSGLPRDRRAWLACAGASLLATGCFLFPPELPKPSASGFVLRGVEVVEPVLSRRHGDLVVSDGILQGPGESPASLSILDEFAGSTVLPGLMDLHSHLPPKTPLHLTEYFGLLYLAHGVTTLREAGDIDGTAVAAAQRALDEGAPMPRVRSCGPFVGGPNPRWANSVVVEKPEDAARIVATLRDEGRVCVKIYDGLDRPRVQALVRAAREAGLVPMGHVPFGLTLGQAAIPDTQHLMGVARPEDIAAGDSILHRIVDWRAVVPERLDEVVAASVSLGLTHTPTLESTHELLRYQDYAAALDDPLVRLMPGMYRDVIWSPSEGLAVYRSLGPVELAMLRDAYAKRLVLVRGLHEAGVPLHLGTDTQQPWVVPGASLWRELGHFVEAGIPVEEALADATWRASPGVIGGSLGRLVAGAPADLLIFRSDPTRDLAALATLEAVVIRGQLYRRADLLASVEAWRGWYDGALVDWLAKTVARRRIRTTVTSDH